MTAPDGFPAREHAARRHAAQARMAEAGLDALLLTTEPEIRYFTGFLTRFWESPTRPWFLVLPAAGPPVAVIPEIGAALMARTGLADIRTWPAPGPGDEGIALLADTLREAAGPRGRIGTPKGPETHLRMPLADWEALGAMLGGPTLADDAGIMRALRMVKSPAEVARIRETCAVAGRAFDRLPEVARAGVPLSAVFRGFQALLLGEGADWVPYLSGAAAPEGYGDVISPATEAPLAPGDVLMLDTGAVRAGYFCDFDRNLTVGPATPSVRAAHARLVEAAEAGRAAARPGATAADLFHAMDRVLTGGAGTGATGRLGHGVGMTVTEPPSLLPWDRTEIRPGMVLALEPIVEAGPGRILVHEENVVVTETGAEFLSPPAGALPVALEG